MKRFYTEERPGGVREEWFSDRDGNITRKVSQNSQGVVEAVHAMRDHARGKNQHYLGSVPETVAAEWAKQCGAAVGTREFAEYAKKQLMSSDWAKLSSGVKV